MKTAAGRIEEIFLDGSARIRCPPEAVPAPGQYLLVHARASPLPLAVPVFYSDSAPQGFRSAPALPAEWNPGISLSMRGPIGRGFSVPPAARKLALIAFDDSPSRLRGVLSLALRQKAEVALVCDYPTGDLPEIVEVHPLQFIPEILQWADFTAMDAARENLNQLKDMLGDRIPAAAGGEAQILIRTPMPCGALAECGVCAVTFRHGWKLTCRDGPVFGWKEVF
jgi:dihydroorotate dehydrogenase electron transfer subunit